MGLGNADHAHFRESVILHRPLYDYGLCFEERFVSREIMHEPGYIIQSISEDTSLTYHEEDNDGGYQHPGSTGIIVAEVIVNLTPLTGCLQFQ